MVCTNKDMNQHHHSSIPEVKVAERKTEMKAIIQRVTQASVTVGEETVSSIGQGLCVLIGIGRYDTAKELEYIARKILNIRLFDGEDGKRWNKSVMDKQLEVLCVSQFTLSAVLKGNKPDFHEAMGPETSEKAYQDFLQIMRNSYSPDKIKDGQFGAYMQVNIQNDGPVTIPLDSPDNLPDPKKKKTAMVAPSVQSLSINSEEGDNSGS